MSRANCGDAVSSRAGWLRGANRMSAICTLVIPARRDSKRLPGKNISLFAGRSLIEWSLTLWSHFLDEIDILVSTDDVRVMDLATSYPAARFLLRPPELSGDAVTLDEVATFIATTQSLSTDYLAVAQCTCPLVSLATARLLLEAMHSSGATSIAAAVREHGFLWRRTEGQIELTPLFDERVNTQFARSCFLRESGVFTATRMEHLLSSGSRFSTQPLLVEIPREESLDIDDGLDWRIGQAIRARLNLVFVAICNAPVGTGHLHRCMEIASWFADLPQQFFVYQGDGVEQSLLAAQHREYARIDGLDLPGVHDSVVVLDVLDVEAEVVARLQANGNTVFVFESRPVTSADFTFNSLYKPLPGEPANHPVAHGPGCAVVGSFLAPVENRFQFREDVGRVVVFFGGTDPSRLRQRVVPLVDAAFAGIDIHVFSNGIPRRVETITPAGNRLIERPVGPDFFGVVADADLFIGSAGQTMMQVAHIGVPSVIIAHSPREQDHIVGEVASCITYAGCAEGLDDPDLLETIQAAAARHRRKEVSDNCRDFSLSGGNAFVAATMRERIEERHRLHDSR